MALTLNYELDTLNIGDYIWCRYTNTKTGEAGVFSEFATVSENTALNQEIPYSGGDIVDGYFRFIVVGKNQDNNWILVSDRVVQHSLSWTTINENVFEFPLAITSRVHARSKAIMFSGGSISSDSSEWNDYIVNNDLDGNITNGDDNTWNWSNLSSFTSSFSSTTNTDVVVRGLTASDGWSVIDRNTKSTTSGFRPVIVMDILPLNKSFILHNGEYLKYNGDWQSVSRTLPNTNTFKNEGMDDISILNRKIKDIVIPMDDNTLSGVSLGSGLLFKEKVSYFKFKQLYGISVRNNR